MIAIDDKTKCSGCTVCYAVCPVGCIKMKMDEEGFYYPFVNTDKCIKCGKCENVCPVSNGYDHLRSDKMQVYGCQNRQDDIRLQSTSGGMFTVLAEYIIEQGGVVCGAGYDEHCHVVHKMTETKEELGELRSSKYTQSDLNNCFKKIKQFTDAKNRVLFVGTPCQVEGLISYIGGVAHNEYLLTADLECYGVPSPGLYDKYIAFIEKKYKSEVEKIFFRDKKYGYYGVNVKIVLKNGRVLEDNLDVKSYLKSMFSKLGLRPICYNCPFRIRHKMSDYTLGDFWRIGEVEKSMDDDIGTTRLKINTVKGEMIFREISDRTRYCLIEDLVGNDLDSKLNAAAIVRTCDMKKRRDFFRDMNTLEYSLLIKKYLPDTLKDRVNNIMKPMIYKTLPKQVYLKIFRGRKIK